MADMLPDNFKELIENTISDLVTDFIYEDRKEDEELTIDMIAFAFKNKITNVDSIAALFKNELTAQLKNNQLI